MLLRTRPRPRDAGGFVWQSVHGTCQPVPGTARHVPCTVGYTMSFSALPGLLRDWRPPQHHPAVRITAVVDSPEEQESRRTLPADWVHGRESNPLASRQLHRRPDQSPCANQWHTIRWTLDPSKQIGPIRAENEFDVPAGIAFDAARSCPAADDVGLRNLIRGPRTKVATATDHCRDEDGRYGAHEEPPDAHLRGPILGGSTKAEVHGTCQSVPGTARHVPCTGPILRA